MLWDTFQNGSYSARSKAESLPLQPHSVNTEAHTRANFIIPTLMALSIPSPSIPREFDNISRPGVGHLL